VKNWFQAVAFKFNLYRYAKDSVIEKLKLKNTSLKTQISKLEQQLQQKEEMGEVLHVIDFDQLKIENQQYLERIEERNNELLRLKLTTGKTVATLNMLKKKLGEITKKGEWLRKETVGGPYKLNPVFPWLETASWSQPLRL
jgi:hypothetical protein